MNKLLVLWWRQWDLFERSSFITLNLRPWTNKLFTVTQEILILFDFAADFHLSQYLPFIHQQWRSLTNSGSLTPSFWWSHRLWSDCSGELLQLRIISRLLAAYSIHVVFLRISGNSSWTCNPTFHVFYHLIRNFPENLFSPFPDFLSVRLWKLDPVKFQLYHTR